MVTITIDALVSEDRRLIYDLPPDVPVGQVKLTIEPIAAAPNESPSADGEKKPLTREEARRRLAAAGRLSTIHYSPEEVVRSSPEESERLARLFSDDHQTTLELINLDRGPRIELSEEERTRIGKLLADDNQTILDLINLDRGPR